MNECRSPAARFASSYRLLIPLLKPGRLQHSLAVAGLAASLAPQLHINPDRAYLAGLLHDCARDLSLKKMNAILKRYRGKYFNGVMRNFPMLWHNPAGVVVARTRFKVMDPYVLRAIALHSTGHPRMLALDKILYVADYCAPGRVFDGVQQLRALALENISEAFTCTVREKVGFYLRQHRPVHPYSLELAKQLGVL